MCVAGDESGAGGAGGGSLIDAATPKSVTNAPTLTIQAAALAGTYNMCVSVCLSVCLSVPVSMSVSVSVSVRERDIYIYNCIYYIYIGGDIYMYIYNVYNIYI